MKKILILGATSAIAQAVIRRYAEVGDSLYLVARDQLKLEAIAQDLKVRSTGKVYFEARDLDDVGCHNALVQRARSTMNGLDIAFIAYGVLGDQRVAESGFDATLQVLHTNCLSPISLLTVIANDFAEQKSGTIAVITSVAGDRGRGSNYVYGTAKGALSIFLSGLRNRLFKDEVAVVDLRLGFVDTPMTKDFKKGLLWATPDSVANTIVKSIDSRSSIVYGPWFWRWIMLVIKLIPEGIFKRLSL